MPRSTNGMIPGEIPQFLWTGPSDSEEHKVNSLYCTAPQFFLLYVSVSQFLSLVCVFSVL